MSQAARKAVLYRMKTPEHTCPYGLKAKDLLAIAALLKYLLPPSSERG